MNVIDTIASEPLIEAIFCKEDDRKSARYVYLFVFFAKLKTKFQPVKVKWMPANGIMQRVRNIMVSRAIISRRKTEIES